MPGCAGFRKRPKVSLLNWASVPCLKALRKWTASADEFAIAVGRAGFFIVTTTTVHLVRSRGPNHD